MSVRSFYYDICNGGRIFSWMESSEILKLIRIRIGFPEELFCVDLGERNFDEAS